MYEVKNHRLHRDGQLVGFQLTPNRTKGSVIAPEGIVVHDTAGRLDGDTSVSWFLNPAAKASAHLVVHRDGNTTQLAPLDAKCWHAGTSSLNGRAGVNGFSIGIEIVNPGKLTPLGNGRYKSWFGEVYGDGEYDMHYTEEQIDAVSQISLALFTKYDLQWLWPHWKVSPGRKVDTNPLFPLDHLRARLLGRGDDEGSHGVMVTNTNQRRWPSYGDNVIQVIPRGERVEVLRSGWFQNGDEHAQWYLVAHGAHEGWVHGSLIEL
jgi:N-acetylmuramoyl-L-alanine amidase